MRCNLISKLRALLPVVLLLTGSSAAGAKPHIISFGKWTPVQWSAGTNGDDKPLIIKVRALMVDARVKEYVVGLPHDVTTVCSWCAAPSVSTTRFRRTQLQNGNGSAEDGCSSIV